MRCFKEIIDETWKKVLFHVSARDGIGSTCLFSAAKAIKENLAILVKNDFDLNSAADCDTALNSVLSELRRLSQGG